MNKFNNKENSVSKTIAKRQIGTGALKGAACNGSTPRTFTLPVALSVAFPLSFPHTNAECSYEI